MDDWVGPTLHVFLASISKKLYLEDVPKKSDTASLPDTSCHSTVFIGCTQLRDLSVGRDIQITENMRLRNGTIPPPHLCPWPLLFPFFSGLTRESLPSLWSFSSATTRPFYSSASDGLSALREPIAKSAQAERCAGLQSWPSSESACARSVAGGGGLCGAVERRKEQ